MNDQLKHFINKNREALEGVEDFDRDALWLNISNAGHSRPRRLDVILKIAAALILAIGIGLFWLTRPGNTSVSEDKLFQSIMSEYAPDIPSDFEKYQMQLVRSRQALNLENLEREKYSDLLSELEMIDGFKLQSLDDLKKSTQKEKVIHVLIRHHQRQLAILERIASEIEKNKNYDERENLRKIY